MNLMGIMKKSNFRLVKKPYNLRKNKMRHKKYGKLLKKGEFTRFKIKNLMKQKCFINFFSLIIALKKTKAVRLNF
jgi:hypothetical protein